MYVFYGNKTSTQFLSFSSSVASQDALSTHILSAAPCWLYALQSEPITLSVSSSALNSPSPGVLVVSLTADPTAERARQAGGAGHRGRGSSPAYSQHRVPVGLQRGPRAQHPVQVAPSSVAVRQSPRYCLSVSDSSGTLFTGSRSETL